MVLIPMNKHTTMEGIKIQMFFEEQRSMSYIRGSSIVSARPHKTTPFRNATALALMLTS